VKSLFIFLYIFYSFAYAEDSALEVYLSPKEPIANEEFQMKFEIIGDYEGDPYFSFEKGSLEAISKGEEGIKISAVMINGAVGIRKRGIYYYTLKAAKPGAYKIRDIKVTLDNKTLRHGDLNFTVLNEKREPKDAFLVAELSAKDVYLGQAIRLDYFLYSKGIARMPEIKEFPKLNGFIKRFYMPNENPMNVEYAGENFYKSAKYSAVIFPEKTGDLFVDPLKLSVELETRNGGIIFGPFGFQAAGLKNKVLNSEKVAINVKPLPAQNDATTFTGLVGEHEFEFKMEKTKYLVNEPIEFSLTVTGDGALEKMNAPNIYANDAIENFDTKSELVEIKPGLSKKVFQYTLLGRNSLNIPARVLELSFFSPKQGVYQKASISLPELEIVGSLTTNDKNQDIKKPVDNFVADEKEEAKEKIVTMSILAPRLILKQDGKVIFNFANLNMTIFVVLIFVFGFFLFSSTGNWGRNKTPSKLYRKMLSGSATYEEVLKELYNLNKVPVFSVEVIFKNLKVSQEQRKEIEKYIKELEKSRYELNSKKSNFTLSKKTAKAFIEAIEVNENIQNNT